MKQVRIVVDNIQQPFCIEVSESSDEDIRKNNYKIFDFLENQVKEKLNIPSKWDSLLNTDDDKEWKYFFATEKKHSVDNLNK